MLMDVDNVNQAESKSGYIISKKNNMFHIQYSKEILIGNGSRNVKRPLSHAY